MTEETLRRRLGRRIRAARQAIDMSADASRRRPYPTIEEVAEAAGVAAVTLTKIELGYKTPRVETLYMIAGALEVTPHSLLPEAS